jgi:hypothetical protein
MIKYYKFGFGRVTDYVNEEIRLKRISREKAIDLVEKYDDSCSDDYIQSFCSYIDITTDEFWKKVYESVNQDLFKINKDGKITRRFKIGVGL